MKNKLIGKLHISDRGETMVEVMVAFIVLLLVLALLTTAINSASAAQMNSIDTRRTTDSDYKALHETINAENVTYADPSTDSVGNSREKNESDPITCTDGTTIKLTAYKYTSGDTVYWVYR